MLQLWIAIFWFVNISCELEMILHTLSTVDNAIAF